MSKQLEEGLRRLQAARKADKLRHGLQELPRRVLISKEPPAGVEPATY